MDLKEAKMAEEMENVDLSIPSPVPATPSATTMPILEPVVKNGSAMGFIPLVTVVGFHHAR
jgi:hypothetical protein